MAYLLFSDIFFCSLFSIITAFNCKFSSQKNSVLKNREIELKSGKNQLLESGNLARVFQKHSLRSAKALFLHPESTVFAIP
jgi:hypothetical protein